MNKKLISLFLAFCLLCGCTKTEEAPAEIPQESAIQEEIEELPAIQEQSKQEVQTVEAPIPEEVLTEQQQELLHITQSLDIMGLTVDESMSEEEKGLFILWLLGAEKYVDAAEWEIGSDSYKIPLMEIEWMLQDRTMLESIDPVAAFGSKYSEKEQCLYLDMLGGYGGARAHGLVSIEENENRTKIVLGSYDMDTFWAEPPIYTLQEIITAEFEFQWGEWRIVDMSREKIG